MIKPVTFQGVDNFEAHLYALEVCSRFADQTKAHGYYKNYGHELAASVYDGNVIIDTGAFVICGRMCEVTARETVPVTISEGKVGYVVARIETYHPSDENNCTFVSVTASSLSDISLRLDDVYALESKEQNRVFELPVVSFRIAGGSITEVKMLLQPVADYERTRSIVEDALAKAEEAVRQAVTAKTTSETAASDAATAKANAAQAVTDATAAKMSADASSQKVDLLETQIVEKQGTRIHRGETIVGDMQTTEMLLAEDVLIISGGTV